MTSFNQWKTLERIKPTFTPRKWDDGYPNILLDEMGIPMRPDNWSDMHPSDQRVMTSRYLLFVAERLERYRPLEYAPPTVGILGDSLRAQRFFDFGGPERRGMRVAGWYLGLGGWAFNLCRLPETVRSERAKQVARQMASTLMMDLGRLVVEPITGESIWIYPEVFRLARFVDKYKELKAIKLERRTQSLFAKLGRLASHWKTVDQAWVEMRNEIPSSLYFGLGENWNDVI